MIAKWHGLLPYREGLSLQNQMWNETVQDGVTRVIGCEHPLVVTLGKRSQPQIDLRTSGIETVQIDRGGQATLHSPGQLVIYPIFDLRKNKLGVRDFVKSLLGTTQKTLLEYGVETFEKTESAGLYTANGKIVFCGLRIEKGISRHGLSINLMNDLSLFDRIRSCGIENAPMDSLQTFLGTQISSMIFYETWISNFKNGDPNRT